MKRLREIAKIILRDIDRKFGDDMLLHAKYAQAFYLYMRVLLQEGKKYLLCLIKPSELFSLLKFILKSIIGTWVVLKTIN